MVRGRVDFRLLRLTFSSPEEKAKGCVYRRKGEVCAHGRSSAKCKLLDRRGLQPGASGIPLGVEFELAVATMGHGGTLGVDLQVVNRVQKLRRTLPSSRQALPSSGQGGRWTLMSSPDKPPIRQALWVHRYVDTSDFLLSIRVTSSQDQLQSILICNISLRIADV